MRLYVCVCAGRATKSAAVGEGAARAGGEAEAAGGGFWETYRTGGDAAHSDTSGGGGQTHRYIHPNRIIALIKRVKQANIISDAVY